MRMALSDPGAPALSSDIFARYEQSDFVERENLVDIDSTIVRDAVRPVFRFVGRLATTTATPEDLLESFMRSAHLLLSQDHCSGLRVRNGIF